MPHIHENHELFFRDKVVARKFKTEVLKPFTVGNNNRRLLSLYAHRKNCSNGQDCAL